jgi:protein-S-isoprenylcysteine O-methyltransferase Ste14
MSIGIKLLIFFVASAGIVAVSRPALRDRRSHGFYRFFAWESLLLLFLLNVDYWFYEPTSLPQLMSWFCLGVSLLLVILGLRLLRTAGQPDESRSGESLIGLEKTTQLVTTGTYRYIRHPLYSSLLFLAWGMFLKFPSLIGLGLAAATTFFLTVTARVEERENLGYFGPVYQDYMQRTRMFIPFLF